MTMNKLTNRGYTNKARQETKATCIETLEITWQPIRNKTHDKGNQWRARHVAKLTNKNMKQGAKAGKQSRKREDKTKLQNKRQDIIESLWSSYKMQQN